MHKHRVYKDCCYKTVHQILTSTVSRYMRGGMCTDAALWRGVGSLGPLHCLCIQTLCCGHNENCELCLIAGSEGWKAICLASLEQFREGRWKTIPRDPQRELTFPQCKRPAGVKNLHTRSTHLAKLNPVRLIRTARAHLPLFSWSSHTPENELSECRNVHGRLSP